MNLYKDTKIKLDLRNKLNENLNNEYNRGVASNFN